MRLALIVITLVVISTTSVAQDTVKVSIEEVRIPITARDANGRFDPTVELGDLLVRDNGIAQPLKSVYRMPASVLLAVAQSLPFGPPAECLDLYVPRSSRRLYDVHSPRADHPRT